MTISIISAKHPMWVNKEESAINIVVNFSHLRLPVSFTARPDDVELHGRNIFARAVAGEFGEVAPYTAPTAYELAARDNPPLRASKMAEAVDRATHWDMMGDATQAAAWRGYYRELYALEQAPGWPLVEQWPEAPQ